VQPREVGTCTRKSSQHTRPTVDCAATNTAEKNEKHPLLGSVCLLTRGDLIWVRLGPEEGFRLSPRPSRPGPSDNTGKIYSDPVCSELVTLGNIGLCGTALDRAFLLTSNGAGFLQVIGHVGDTTRELAMVAGAFGAFHNKIRDGAAAGE
jgi:hypothetical protein